MKKVFIVGSGPLPNEKEGIRDAAGLRTEQFFRPLQNNRHEITLLCITNKESKIAKELDGSTKIFRISRHDKNLKKYISQKIRQFSPDVCIGVNTFPSYILSTVLPKKMPFWADLNGWIMAESQARSWTEKNNFLFANSWRQQRQILSTADKISTVSTAQKFCTIGEMANMGLLRKENFGEEKVFAIPNTTKFFDIDKTDTSESKKLFRGTQVPNNAFVVSWIGGYNNWVDEETLFNGLEKAMMKNKHIYFVSTGGAIKNIANSTFTKFIERIENSKYKNQFIFLGWIETKDMRKIYEESDCGINVDFSCIETWTGARNRLNEMLKFGLPIITTGGSEISEDIEKYRAGIKVANEDSSALANTIVKMSKMTQEEMDKFRQNGQSLSTEVFNEEKVTKPVQSFAQKPKKTILPALPLKNFFFYAKNIWWYAKQNGKKTFLKKFRQKIGL